MKIRKPEQQRKRPKRKLWEERRKKSDYTLQTADRKKRVKYAAKKKKPAIEEPQPESIIDFIDLTEE
jgi:hypothetical protein